MTDTARDFSPAEIVRIHEANCQLDFVGPEEQNFRVAMMKFIGRKLNLGELKKAEITGTGTGRPRPANSKE
jgi:hypothetical protein